MGDDARLRVFGPYMFRLSKASFILYIRFYCLLHNFFPLSTMCDFHNFGLIFAGNFEIFSNEGCPKGARSVEKISNNVDFRL